MYKNLLLAAVSVVALSAYSAHAWADDGSNNDQNGGSVVGNSNDGNNANQTSGNDNNNSNQNNDTNSPDGNQNNNEDSTLVGGDWLSVGGGSSGEGYYSSSGD